MLQLHDYCWKLGHEEMTYLKISYLFDVTDMSFILSCFEKKKKNTFMLQELERKLDECSYMVKKLLYNILFT